MPCRSRTRLAIRASNFRSRTTGRPTYSAIRRRSMPPVWDRGLAIRLAVDTGSVSGFGSPPRLNDNTVLRTFAQRLPWLRVTPFGLPLDPEVRSTRAAWPSSIDGMLRRIGSAARRSIGSTVTTRTARSVTRASSGAQRATAVPISSAASRAASGGVDGCMATATPPRSQVAVRAGRKRSSLPSRSKTRSPAPIPAFPRSRSSWTADSVRRAIVHGPSSSTQRNSNAGRSALRHPIRLASEPPGIMVA